MIFSSLVALVLVSRPAKLRQDTNQTLARLSNTEQDIFCQVHVWLMFDSKNGIPARVRLDYISVWFKNFVWVENKNQMQSNQVGAVVFYGVPTAKNQLGTRHSNLTFNI